MAAIIPGFSKLSRKNKIDILIQNLHLGEGIMELLDHFRLNESDFQSILDELSENTITNFPTPYGIVPNIKINNKLYHVPVVTEESSVVAAASKAAKIWSERGGFHATVKSSVKNGHVHFIWQGKIEKMKQIFPLLEKQLLESTDSLTANMRKRGGGIKQILLIDKTKEIPGYFQIQVDFDTIDAMGANFINSCLESMASHLPKFFRENPIFIGVEKEVEVVMAILSNYNPDCIVEVFVECPIEELRGIYPDLSPALYARRFKLAVDIAKSDIHRAVTHNKGIFNGIDAVAIATGNDYRAIEAGAHAYASRSGHYQSLSSVNTENDKFLFSLELPLSVGTVGGITSIHPLTKLSHLILSDPNAKELMEIVASIGLASNFSALNALITTGIQKGHMKMHLSNILNQLNADSKQKEEARVYFKNKKVTFGEVERYLRKEDVVG